MKKHFDNAPFFERPWNSWNDKDNYIKSLEKESFLLGLIGEELLKIEWKAGGSHLECFVATELVPYPFAPFVFYYKIGEKTVNILREIRTLISDCTKESCEKAFKNYPTVYEFTYNGFFDDGWQYECDYAWKTARYARSFFFESGWRSAQYFAEDIKKLFKELSYFKLDTSLLERQKPLFEDADFKIPSWVKKAAIIGGIILIKVAVKSIGGDVDLDIPDFDGDVDIDIDIDGPDIDGDVNIDIDGDTDVNFDPDLSEIDSDNDINAESYSEGCETSENLGDSHSDTSNTLHEESYNPSFKAQDATLKSQGGGSTIKVTITREPGTSNQFCIELPSGDKIHNVSGTRNTIKINQIVYKLPVLKG